MKHDNGNRRNECENCNLCCKLMAIAAIDKPENEYCQFISDGKCSIHGITQPVECKNFECFYRAKIVDENPVDSHVVIFTANYMGKLSLFFLEEIEESAMQYSKLMLIALGNGYNVVRRFNGYSTIVIDTKILII